MDYRTLGLVKTRIVKLDFTETWVYRTLGLVANGLITPPKKGKL